MRTSVATVSRGVRCCSFLIIVALLAGCASAGLETASVEPAELKPLGTPTRNIRFEGLRPVEIAALEIHHRNAISDSGSIPIIMHKGETSIVETVFQIVPSEHACRSALEAYHQRLLARLGDKTKHRVACVNVVDGEPNGIVSIADTLVQE